MNLLNNYDMQLALLVQFGIVLSMIHIISNVAIGFVYGLFETNGIFGWIPSKLESRFQFLKENDWLKKMLYACPQCVAGQISFWIAFFSYWANGGNPLIYLAFIVGTIGKTKYLTSISGL